MVESPYITDILCTPRPDGSGVELRFFLEDSRTMEVWVRKVDLPDVLQRMTRAAAVSASC
jgi:hypothetical protein